MGQPPKQDITVYAAPDKTAAAIHRFTDPAGVQILRRSSQFTAMQLDDGPRGFVETQFLEFPSKLLVLNQDQVPMYLSASADSGMATLCKGLLIESVGDEVIADGVSWLPIKFPLGQTGYIRRDTRLSPPSRFFYLRNVSSPIS
jgi:hypothetical protein